MNQPLIWRFGTVMEDLIALCALYEKAAPPLFITVLCTEPNAGSPCGHQREFQLLGQLCHVAANQRVSVHSKRENRPWKDERVVQNCTSPCTGETSATSLEHILHLSPAIILLLASSRVSQSQQTRSAFPPTQTTSILPATAAAPLNLEIALSWSRRGHPQRHRLCQRAQRMPLSNGRSPPTATQTSAP